MKTRRWLPALAAVALLAQPLLALENEPARRDQLKRLRGAIRAYNGLYPDKPLAKLSALIDESFLEGPGALMRPGAATVPPSAELDARADYTLEPIAGAQGMVVRERAPLPGEAEVLAIFSDGNIRALAAPAGGAAVANTPVPATAQPPPTSASAPAPPPPEIASASSSSAASQPFSVPAAIAPPSPSSSAPAPVATAPPPEMTRSLPASSDAASIPAPPSTPAVRMATPPAPQLGVSSATSSPPPVGVTTRGDIPPEMMAALVQFLKGQNNPGQPQTQATTAAAQNFGIETTSDGRTVVTLQPPGGASQPVAVSIPPGQSSTVSADGAAAALQLLAQFGQNVAARQQKAAQERGADLAANNALAQNPQELLKINGTDMSAFNRASAAVSESSAPPSPQVSPHVAGTPSSTTNTPGAGTGKWNVSHQLVQGLPWPSASWPERQVLARVKDAEPTPDQRLVNALNDLAGWYRGRGRLAEAYDTYQKVRGIQTNRGLAEHYDYALVANDIGVVLTELKRYQEADYFFHQAKDHWETYWTAPLPTEDYAVMLHNYAYVANLRGNTRQAAEFEAKAAEVMEIRRRAIGP